MRILAFLIFAMLCNLYGLAFDLVAASSIDGFICILAEAGSCPIPQAFDYWLSVMILLLGAPLFCFYLAHWFSINKRLLRFSAFMGLMLVTP